MKQKYAIRLLLITLLSFSFVGFSQTQLEIEKIKKNSNLTKLASLSKTFKTNFLNNREKALRMAREKGWRIKYQDNSGNLHELIKVTEEGKPMYYKTDNVNAAISTRTNFLHNGGGLGLNLEGQGMTVYIWDGGLARATHQEYDGAGGDNRYSAGDGSGLNFHGAHVTGTIIASGVDADAKGMAPQAKAIGYNWTNDESEMTDAAANGMIISNHSYGFALDDVSPWIAGAYISNSRDLDEIMYNAPFYLNVTSAGNSGNDNSSNTDPLEGNSAYDKLTGWSTSKNNLVIANARDANINPADGSVIGVTINSGSSEGPTDDLRIKPDLAGNGTSLRSTFETSDTAYGSISGTSMSSPNVCGSLLLIQQHFNETQGSFMRGATLKGLALHTADDQGSSGPDAIWGWGLLNSRKIAETINDRGLLSEIKELELAQGETYTLTVKSDGVNPLIASITWTDVPGTAAVNSTSLNDGTPVLVNDLDLRVSNTSDTFLPWRLANVTTNEKGDNVVDPFERVDVGVGSGEYTITVTHKGTLSSGSQRFSLILTGTSSDFTISTSEPKVEACAASNAQFSFNYRQAAPTTTNFSAANMPAGVTANFSTNSLSADDTFTVTFENLAGLDPGTYDVDVVGDNGVVTKTETVQIVIFKDDFTGNPMVLSAPADELKGVTTSQLELSWNSNLNAQSYLVQVSDTPSFSNIISSSTETGLSYTVSGLTDNTVYYWRVKPQNTCGTNSEFSAARSFQTGGSDCTYTYTATDFSSAFVNALQANQTASVPISVTDDVVIDKITANVTIDHTNVSNLRVFLQEPSALGSNNTFLLENPCDDTDNIDATFDDDGAALSCSTTEPAITGTIAPFDNLSNHRGKNSIGTWFIAMQDVVAGDGGSITAATITICTTLANSAPASFTTNVIEGIANNSVVLTSTHMEATTASETAAEQVYTLVVAPTVGSLTKNGVTMVVGDTFTQEDINTGIVSFTNTQTSSFNDEFKVDILNAANGWLPNQTVSVSVTASNKEFDLGSLSIYPNPASTEINVRINATTNEDVRIQLFDLQGRLIKAAKFTAVSGGGFSDTLDVRGVSSGVYLIKIKQGIKQGTRKLIITN
ncbi:MAG: S8 family serine peptidase [Flavobacteriaceae bacterium]